jgi:delta-aminolevulinic acid dehydratase/porphobilinogen synthase
MALLPLAITDAYMETHARDVFIRADTNKDNMLDFHEFSQYTLALESFRSRDNDTNFRSLMSRVFDAMDKNGDGFVTPANMGDGVIEAIMPARERFGFAVTTIAGIVLVFVAIYWAYYFTYQRDKIERDLPQERGEEEALVGDENAENEELPDNVDLEAEDLQQPNGVAALDDIPGQ